MTKRDSSKIDSLVKTLVCYIRITSKIAYFRLIHRFVLLRQYVGGNWTPIEHHIEQPRYTNYKCNSGKQLQCQTTIPWFPSAGNGSVLGVIGRLYYVTNSTVGNITVTRPYSPIVNLEYHDHCGRLSFKHYVISC